MNRDLKDQTSGNQLKRCLYCGHPAPLIWVHGHGQCSNCGINTDECCRGESCEVEIFNSKK